MIFLPLDLKYKIVSYLPIKNETRLKLNRTILNSKKIYDIIRLYKNHWNRFEEDPINEELNYEGWLVNDITRWMNDDDGTMYSISCKFKKYASKIFNVPVIFVST